MKRRAWPHKAAIVGLGLIGGSLALAIRRTHPEIELIGIDRDEPTLKLALAQGAIDWGTPQLEEGVAGADLIVLATPVSSILEILPRLPDIIREDAIVTDTGSTKRMICQAAGRVLPERFVGGHPMAGAERQGFLAARAELLEGAVYVLTPTLPSDKCAQRLASFLETIGVRVRFMSPERHDQVVAATSHLPQLLSITLATLLAQQAEEDEAYYELVAGGAWDWLRTAASPYEIWRDVFATNANEIERVLKGVLEELHQWRNRLETGGLQESFQQARRFQTRLSRVASPCAKGYNLPPSTFHFHLDEGGRTYGRSDQGATPRRPKH